MALIYLVAFVGLAAFCDLLQLELGKIWRKKNRSAVSVFWSLLALGLARFAVCSCRI
jgi:hypothetical protein